MKYYIDKGTYKEFIRDEKGLFQCPYCGEYYKAIAYHTRQVHKVFAKDLRQEMGLSSNYVLVTDDIHERHKEIVEENKETHIKTNLLKKGTKTRFEKGSEGHTKNKWSPFGLEKLRKRNKGMRK